MKFLPGSPNLFPYAVAQGNWHNSNIVAYCSGESLVILTGHFKHLQTIPLESKCHSVAINNDSGLIAVSCANIVKLFCHKRKGLTIGNWVHCLDFYHDKSDITCVKWGKDNDIVLASHYLSFWNIKEEYGEFHAILLWNKLQPQPIYDCSICDDSKHIATVGKFDKHVKVWKRIENQDSNILFQLAIVPHPKYVTKLRWKRYNKEKRNDSTTDTGQVLYTLCEDNTLRIFECYGFSLTGYIQQWGSIQLEQNHNFCSIVDSWLIQECLSKNKKCDLFTVSDPDIILSFDKQGNAVVRVIDGLSHIPPKLMKIRKEESKKIQDLVIDQVSSFLYIPQIHNYDKDPTEISIVLHDTNGIIIQFSIAILDLLESNNHIVGHFHHKWTGDTEPIEQLIRNPHGDALISLTKSFEAKVWRTRKSRYSDRSYFWLQSKILTNGFIKTSVVLSKGKLTILLLDTGILQIVDCHCIKATIKQEIDVRENNAVPISLMSFKTSKTDDGFFISFFFSKQIQSYYIDENLEFHRCNDSKIPIDSFIISTKNIDFKHEGTIESFPLISILTDDTDILTLSASVNVINNTITWKTINLFKHNVESISLFNVSATEKLCLVDSSNTYLTIWDLHNNICEYEQHFQENIKSIDWISTEQEQELLCVAFDNCAFIYSQTRYDYVHDIPAYLAISRIALSDIACKTINAISWLKNGSLVFACGNQLFVKDKKLNIKDSFLQTSLGSRVILSRDIFNLSLVLNGPLPVYHPQFLIQALYFKKLSLVKEILLKLFLKLRKANLHADGVLQLSSFFDIEDYKFLIDDYKCENEGNSDDIYSKFDNKIVKGLTDLLTKIALPYLTRHQHITLITVAEAVELISSNRDIIDYNGLCFLLGFKLLQSHKLTQKCVTMRDINWAVHSNNKELIWDKIKQFCDDWENTKMYKVTFWLKIDDLKEHFEYLAKKTYTSSETKDPTMCAIFYLSLQKKNIILNLWKLSISHPEQQKMIKFLKNDFNEERWKLAALKNAYVLLSKHRYREAANLFLLGGSVKDCAFVVSRYLKDLDLAIGICRVFEGDNGPVLTELLKMSLLPTAIKTGDRWTTSYIYWKMKRPDIAINALIEDPDILIESQNISITDHFTRSYKSDDPALLVLYDELRKKNIAYYLASIELEHKIQIKAVLKAVHVLKKMGCDRLALSLVRNWQFIDATADSTNLLSLPKRTRADSTIDYMPQQPTSPTNVRPTLFDKFGNSSSLKGRSRISSITSLVGRTEKSTRSRGNSIQTMSSLENDGKILQNVDAHDNQGIDNTILKEVIPIRFNNNSNKEDFSSTRPRKMSNKFMNGYETDPLDINSNVLLENTEEMENFNLTKSHIPALASPRNLLDDFMM